MAAATAAAQTTQEVAAQKILVAELEQVVVARPLMMDPEAAVVKLRLLVSADAEDGTKHKYFRRIRCKRAQS